MSYDDRPRWRHRKGDRYVVVTARVVGNPATGYTIEHYLGTGEYDRISTAAAAGVRDCDSDDFNIGAIRGGELRAITWMGEIVDDEPALMAEIAAEIGLS